MTAGYWPSSRPLAWVPRTSIPPPKRAPPTQPPGRYPWHDVSAATPPASPLQSGYGTAIARPGSSPTLGTWRAARTRWTPISRHTTPRFLAHRRPRTTSSSLDQCKCIGVFADTTRLTQWHGKTSPTYPKQYVMPISSERRVWWWHVGKGLIGFFV